MLVLTRKKHQSIMVGDNIEISILDVIGDKVRIGIQAPREVSVFRKEVFLEIQAPVSEVPPAPEPPVAPDGGQPGVGFLATRFRRGMGGTDRPGVPRRRTPRRIQGGPGLGSARVSWFTNTILDPIQSFLLGHGGVVAYLIVFGLVFAEDALFVGFVIPGETAAVLGGVLASRGSVDVWVMMAVVVVAAIAGDTVGYEIGRHLGTPRAADPAAAPSPAPRAARAGVRARAGRAVGVPRPVRGLLPGDRPGAGGHERHAVPALCRWNALGGIVWGVGCRADRLDRRQLVQARRECRGHGGGDRRRRDRARGDRVWVVRRRRRDAAEERAAEATEAAPSLEGAESSE